MSEAWWRIKMAWRILWGFKPRIETRSDRSILRGWLLDGVETHVLHGGASIAKCVSANVRTGVKISGEPIHAKETQGQR